MTTDDDLMTELRTQFTEVRMNVDADRIMARSQAARRRRRGWVASGTLVVALAAGLGIPALTGGASGDAASRTTLTAWKPGGAIDVTIRELNDLPALQAKLAADGARTAVGTGSVTPPAGCQVGPANPAPFLPEAVTFHSVKTGYYLTIRPGQVPAGDMIRVAVTEGGGPGIPGSAAVPGLFVLLVQDSPHCGF